MTDVIERQGDSAVVMPDENFTASLTEEIKPKLKSLVDSGVKTIVFDFTKVIDIDSISIGLVVSTHNSLTKAQGCIKVINATKDILELFGTMRLDRHFSVEAARNPG